MKKIVGINIGVDLLKYVDEMARKNQRSRSAEVRYCLFEYYEKEKCQDIRDKEQIFYPPPPPPPDGWDWKEPADVE